VYPGPIGAILTPQLIGIENAKTLPFASSLCGACYEVCPVKIDIPSVLLHLRRRAVETRPDRREAAALRLVARAMGGPRRFALAERFARAGWSLRKLPGPLRAWTRTRDLQQPARQTFRTWWRSR
jgi:L-lactate dehydrogenase complex protein LldF